MCGSRATTSLSMPPGKTALLTLTVSRAADCRSHMLKRHVSPVHLQVHLPRSHNGGEIRVQGEGSECSRDQPVLPGV